MMLKKIHFISCVVLLAVSITFFLLGVFTPMLSTRVEVLGVGFNKTQVNLLESVSLFFKNGEYLLAAIIVLFTIIMPAYKYIELAYRCLVKRKYTWIYSIDKWSMLDVFLVALLLLNFKMSDSFMVMELCNGTTFIALAILTRILVIELIKRYEQI